MKLTVRDAAKMLHVTEDDIHRFIREREIPVHRVHDHYRFHRAELLEWATARGIRVSSDEFHASVGDGGVRPRFAAALERGGIHYGVGGKTREEVLRAVVACMPIEDEEERELLYDFMIAREALGSTGVGDGIAIPHVRNPIVLHVAEPAVTLAFLETPVDFGAIDGVPVDTVFSVVSSTVRGHLYLLSRLSAALHDARFARAVKTRASREEILAEAQRVEGSIAP